MSKILKRLVILSSQEKSIKDVFYEMGSKSRKLKFPGIAVIIDKDLRVVGVVTDGDIRRAFAEKIPFNSPISEIMEKKPITLLDTTPKDLMIPLVAQRFNELKKNRTNFVRHLILVDINKRITNVVDLFDVILSEGNKFQNVTVLGLGFVGLTLATTLANLGHQVVGVDINLQLVKDLNNLKVEIHEPGLKEILGNRIKKKTFKILSKIPNNLSSIYIIAVGTPLKKNNLPNLIPIKNVLKELIKVLKKGDHIMIRSTVPIGTTRDLIIPFLKKNRKLEPGKDFYVSFVPERVVEGDALRELRYLPQIIGGFSDLCLKKAAEFWSIITPTIVRTASLEAAEIVKLANNSFRDLSFAFANEIGYLCSKFNINAFDVIKAANDGYPRNKIPLPSPGVGGYCLTKDPYLLSSSIVKKREDVYLGRTSRYVNKKSTIHIAKNIEKYIKSKKMSLSKLSILLVGIAFKGEPETNDVRGSTSIEIKNYFKNKVRLIKGWDAVLSKQEIKNCGFETVKSLDEGIFQSDIIMILNNHRLNSRSSFYYKNYNFKLIFDGWNQLNSEEIESLNGLTYSTVGYISRF